jgi:hypothetical protein
VRGEDGAGDQAGEVETTQCRRQLACLAGWISRFGLSPPELRPGTGRELRPAAVYGQYGIVAEPEVTRDAGEVIGGGGRARCPG